MEVVKEEKKQTGALNILITAGGTSEHIDDVRRITNSGTGALGAKVAEAFADALLIDGRECRITYICSENAIRPALAASMDCFVDGASHNDKSDISMLKNVFLTESAYAAMPAVSLKVHVADNVRAVEDAVCSECAETAFDVIVHSMAIGDYQVRAVSDADRVAQSVLERLSLLICGDSSSPDEAVRDALLSPPAICETKISSDKENLIVVLEKAPKIIALYRSLAPEAVLVGFKLLSDVREETLVSAGHALLIKNGCDFVLANDLGSVRSGSHDGLLIARDGSYERASGKEAIAALIVKRTMELL